MASLRACFLPNRVIDRFPAGLVVAFWAVAALVVWVTSPFRTLPGPGEIWHALGRLWWQGGMGPEIFTTMRLIGHATLLTVIVSLALSYATVIPFVRPLVGAVSKLRFLGLTGLVFPFTLA